MIRTSVVIDREYGSGGHEVARILAEKLGWQYYDGRGLVKAGQQHGIDLVLRENFDEKGVGGFLYDLSIGGSSALGLGYHGAPFQIYETQSRIMKRLVQDGPCIFLGRCAYEILKDVTPVLNVFVYASNEQDRIRRAAKVDGVTGGNVSAYLKKRDLERKRYQKFFTEKEWGDPGYYDMMLNTSSMGYEKAACAICGALQLTSDSEKAE